ncbi:transcriptional activator RfaH [Mesorhizobium sp. M1B.F.Ca.ET.045.04.1.1]|uniref:transcription termination/antitermination protein NusG n=1 Tax=Mesorhizobium sp. M1B.F.Ca.ET.045.04.1.1 TaxID=2493673 RepID=UPI000F74EFF1|nr:transcriptional activator RfaH [Mesorhizobium sp. M1B.F.Ca.ET.045.04.1.1]AZO32326.1 transcriptional activator RfaH [Mesorhizobium sp. M1B.F.Ca.ET.045.04.1.1]
MKNLFALALPAEWFVVATKARKEAVAALNLDNQGFRVFLPRMRRTVCHARKKSTRTIPLFPGYLFVKASEGARWRSVNGTYGVVKILTSGEAPATVERGFIDALKARAGVDDIIDFSVGLQPGDRVELIGGPFARQIGALASLDEKGRVTVLLELLGGCVPVSTTAQNLLPA